MTGAEDHRPNSSVLRLPRLGVDASLWLQPGPFATSAGTVGVLLFGWMGAQPRHLAKYAAVWTAALRARGLGAAVLGLVLPLWLSFDASLRDAAATSHSLLLEDLDDLLSDPGCPLSAPPLVLQFFSNGGAYVFEVLSLTSSQPKRRVWLRRVDGLVFDSCPVDIVPSAVQQVVQNTLGAVGGGTAWGFYRILRTVQRLLSETPPDDDAPSPSSAALRASGYFTGDRRALFARRMLESPLRLPELYLFSLADTITDAAFVER